MFLGLPQIHGYLAKATHGQLIFNKCPESITEVLAGAGYIALGASKYIGPNATTGKEGAPTDLTNCEMGDKPSEDLASCTACLYMLCAHCRSLHKPEQHNGGGQAVALDRRAHDEILRRTAMVRIGDAPHGETPKVKQFEPDCSDCSKWYERFNSVFREELNLYLREQEGVSKERHKGIMNDLEISEEIGGPL